MAASSFFGGEFFGGEFFNLAGAKTGTGGIDPGEARHRGIIKPTGLLHRPKARSPQLQERLERSLELHREVSHEIAKEFLEPEALKPIERMSMAEIDSEIRSRLTRKVNEAEDLLLLMLIAAS